VGPGDRFGRLEAASQAQAGRRVFTMTTGALIRRQHASLAGPFRPTRFIAVTICLSGVVVFRARRARDSDEQARAAEPSALNDVESQSCFGKLAASLTHREA
jgi:hypothetical protein